MRGCQPRAMASLAGWWVSSSPSTSPSPASLFDVAMHLPLPPELDVSLGVAAAAAAGLDMVGEGESDGGERRVERGGCKVVHPASETDSRRSTPLSYGKASTRAS